MRQQVQITSARRLLLTDHPPHRSLAGESHDAGYGLTLFPCIGYTNLEPIEWYGMQHSMLYERYGSPAAPQPGGAGGDLPCLAERGRNTCANMD